jgi:DNA-binding NtrC family response regulator
MRLGAKEVSKVDVRVMAATHCDLEKAIAEGRFREDLYYRLNIIDVHIPALRHRLDEVIPLAEYFLTKHAAVNAAPLELPSPLKRALLEHDWPGNIRELENVMRRYLVVRDAELLVTEIHRKMRKRNPAMAARPVPPPAPERESVSLRRSEPDTEDGGDITVFAETGSARPAAEVYPVNVPESTPPYQAQAGGNSPTSILEKVDSARKAAEAEAILAALNSTLWNRKQAAVLLNIDYKALLYKMKKLGIGARPGDPAQPDTAEIRVAAAKA